MLYFIIFLWVIQLVEFTSGLRRSRQRIILAGLFTTFFSVILSSLFICFNVSAVALNHLAVLTFFNFDNMGLSLVIIWLILFLNLLIYINFFLTYNGLLYTLRKEDIFILISITYATIFLALSVDFINFTLLLELQTFSFLLIIFGSGFVRHLEASLKFFLISGLSAVFNLLGIALIFFQTGLLNFFDVSFFIDGRKWIANSNEFDLINVTVLNDYSLLFFDIGLFFIIINLLFKVGVGGFHQWVPDVYEGSSELGFVVLSVLSKVAGLFILFRFMLYFINISNYSFWILFLLFFSLFSLIISLFHNLYQLKLRRFFAYSSIAQMGYILFCLVLNNLEGFILGFLLIMFYLLSLLNILLIFSSIIFLDQNATIKHLRECVSLTNANPYIAILVLISFFNFLGIPPLTNFIIKFYLLGLLSGFEYWIFWVACVVFFLLTIQSMFYYLRVLRFILIESLNVVRRFLSKITEIQTNFIILLLSSNFWLIFYADHIFLTILNVLYY